MSAVRHAGEDGMRPGDAPILPLWLRTGVLTMLLAALLVALFATKDDPFGHIERGDVTASRELRFADGADGSIRVTDADDGRELVSIEVGEGGFVRSVMRGLARERLSRGIGQEAPFVVKRWSNGYVSLEDPATDTVVELTAFGPDNVQAFSRLVAAPDPT